MWVILGGTRSIVLAPDCTMGSGFAQRNRGSRYSATRNTSLIEVREHGVRGEGLRASAQRSDTRGGTRRQIVVTSPLRQPRRRQVRPGLLNDTAHVDSPAVEDIERTPR